MFETTPTGRPKLQSEDDRMMIEFAKFLSRHSASSEQIREAYYRLVGISESDSHDPVVEEIYNEMRSMTDRKFPLNRFATISGRKQEYEDAKLLCFRFIDSLSISDKEKKMLCSIVEQRRSGELFLRVNGQEVAQLTINVREDVPAEVAALNFMEALKQAITHIEGSKEYGFSFTER